MRRATKSSSTKRSTHLDLVDDDGIGSSKIHKPKTKSKADLAKAIFCALVALGTLYYNYDKVFNRKGKTAKVKPLTYKERILPHQLSLPPDSIYRTKVEDIHGERKQLMEYSGSVSLVVNVACEWGLTHSNYKELAVLHERYKSRGFKVLAFPSNDFHQEKNTNAEILDYVKTNFPEVHFPMFSRAPLATNIVFQLCQKHTNEGVEWNL